MEKGVQIGDYACSILLNGLCNNWKVSVAEGVLQKLMEEKRLVPTVVIYNTIIEGFCWIGDTGETPRIARIMEPPNTLTYMNYFY